MLLVPGESYYFICTLHNFKFKVISIAPNFWFYSRDIWIDERNQITEKLTAEYKFD